MLLIFAYEILDPKVKEARDLDRVAENVHRLTSFLTKEDIGHNVFITRFDLTVL